MWGGSARAGPPPLCIWGLVSTFSTFSAVITERVRDAAGKLSSTAIQTALDAALEEYTRDRPRLVVVEVDGDGGFDYPVSDFGAAASGSTASTQWAEGVSSIADVVFPYVAASRVLPSLEPDDFALVRLPLPTGWVLRFLAATPAATESALVTFTRPHEVTVDLSTVPSGDEQAVSTLAAAFALETLAAFYAQATDSTFDADVADHRGRTNVYLDLARTYRRQYYAHVGRKASGDTSTPVAAGGFVDMDRGFANGSRTDYFFHGRRAR